MDSVISLVIDQWLVVVLSGIIVAQLVNSALKTFTLPSGIAEDTPLVGITDAPISFYSLPGACGAVSSSGFCTKLNLYLRMAGVAHTVAEADFTKAPKGKVPYIKHDGKAFSDSQLVIRYLENTFDLASMSNVAAKHYGAPSFVPFSSLTAHQQAISDAVRLLCEGEIYWAITSIRWLGARGISKSEVAWQTTIAQYFAAIPAPIRGIITAMIRVDVYRNTTGQGIGRHSPNDQLYLACRDITSLSTLLGDQEYFTGTAPTECDTAAFAMLDGILNADVWPNEMTEHCKKHLNLVQYTQRLHSIYFKDLSPDSLTPGCEFFQNKKKQN